MMKEFLVNKTVVYECVIRATSEEHAKQVVEVLHLDNYDFAETVASEVFELREDGCIA